MRWSDLQPAERLCTTSVTVFEIRYGLSMLDDGRARREREQAFERVVEREFRDRVWPLDEGSARRAGVLAAEFEQRGRMIGAPDTFIAGIAAHRGATLATRNTRHFAGLGLTLVNPWDAV